ncbi:polycomb group protein FERTILIZATION-INDEPENDENT SEED 2 isoform X2 [Dendroctonus ponderosae]|uniref:polycomb group protein FERTILIZATION-INDEPENDENT SEED 2 isoform X2 n=1 Tax=Dendroctonus ponderosae TaxID=77166 RepID=UPI002035F936|nr:polycomb group protein FERTILIZATION-INDEPENDENT SEED 2 isoform X2 [Dendroctonus ponderosae]
MKSRAEKRIETEGAYTNRMRQIMDESETLVVENSSDMSYMSELELPSERVEESQLSEHVKNLTALLSSVLATCCRSCSCCRKIADIFRTRNPDSIYDKSPCIVTTLVSSTPLSEKNTEHLFQKKRECCEPNDAEYWTNTQNLDIGNHSQPKIKKSSKNASDRKASTLNDPESPLADKLDSKDERIVNTPAPKSKKRMNKKISTNESEILEAGSNQRVRNDAKNETNTQNLNIGNPSQPKIKKPAKKRRAIYALPGKRNKASGRKASKLNDSKSPLANTLESEEEIMVNKSASQSKQRKEKKRSTDKSEILEAGSNQPETSTKTATDLSERHTDISQRNDAKNQTNSQILDISNNSQLKIKKSGRKKRTPYTLPGGRKETSDRKASKLKSPLANTLDSEDEIMVNKSASKSKQRKEKKRSTDESEILEPRSNQPETSSKTATELSERNTDISQRDDIENQTTTQSLDISYNKQPKARKGKKRRSLYKVPVPQKKVALAKDRISDIKSPQVSTLDSESETTENHAKSNPKKPTGNKLASKGKQNLSVQENSSLPDVGVKDYKRSKSQAKKVDSVKKQPVKSLAPASGKKATGKSGKGATGETCDKKGQNSPSDNEKTTEKIHAAPGSRF